MNDETKPKVPFNLEKFKAEQKALTREGHVATFVGICEKCENFHRLLVLIEGDDQVTSYSLNGEMHNCIGTYSVSRYDLVSMVSRHQALIDNYDPEDTWQYRERSFDKFKTIENPSFDDETGEYRLHPHNELIKAWKRGAKIEVLNYEYIDKEYWINCKTPDWHEDRKYRIKPEFEYPIYKMSKRNRIVVKFTGLYEGTVIDKGNSVRNVGEYRRDWFSHTHDSWQDWTPPSETVFNYPIYKQSINGFNGLVVKFTDLNSGEVVASGETEWTVGEVFNCWAKHTDSSVWQDYDPPKPKQIHCLAYNTRVFKRDRTGLATPKVVTKDIAQSNGWIIIQEWEACS